MSKNIDNKRKDDDEFIEKKKHNEKEWKIEKKLILTCPQGRNQFFLQGLQHIGFI